MRGVLELFNPSKKAPYLLNANTVDFSPRDLLFIMITLLVLER